MRQPIAKGAKVQRVFWDSLLKILVSTSHANAVTTNPICARYI